MKIDILSKTTLKLTLTAEDMDRCGIRCESFSERGDCRKTIDKLLRQSEKGETAARLLGDRRVFVETFRRVDGGCMLYVSAMPKNGGLLDESVPVSPLIAEVRGEKALGALCRCLAEELRLGAEFSSRVYADGDVYRVAVLPENTCRGRVIRLFSEFGEIVPGELGAAYTEEHFTLMIPENAAETGTRIFL